jgi:hypothetical protein
MRFLSYQLSSSTCLAHTAFKTKSVTTFMTNIKQPPARKELKKINRVQEKTTQLETDRKEMMHSAKYARTHTKISFLLSRGRQCAI